MLTASAANPAEEVVWTGGLFRLNPLTVTTPDGKEHAMFAFAAP